MTEYIVMIIQFLVYVSTIALGTTMILRSESTFSRWLAVGTATVLVLINKPVSDIVFLMLSATLQIGILVLSLLSLIFLLLILPIGLVIRRLLR